MSRKSKQPIISRRRRSRGGVRGHLARRNDALAETLARLAVKSMSNDGHLRIPFSLNVPRKVRKQAFTVAATL